MTQWHEQNALLAGRGRGRGRGGGLSFLTSVHVAGAGTWKSAAFALVDGSAPLHTMSLSSIQTHGSAMRWWVAGVWVQGLGIPWTLLGCPCRSPGQVKYTGGVPYHRSWLRWR